MGRWEHRYLGWDRFPDPSTPIEIEQLFTLESDELACAKARRTPLHRLAVALHIVFLKTTGRLLNSVEIVPVSVLELSRPAAGLHATALDPGALPASADPVRPSAGRHRCPGPRHAGRACRTRPCRLSPARGHGGVRSQRAHGARPVLAGRSPLPPASRTSASACGSRRAPASATRSPQSHRRGGRGGYHA